MKEKWFYTETYMLDIMREGWKSDDERLQRVVLR